MEKLSAKSIFWMKIEFEYEIEQRESFLNVCDHKYTKSTRHCLHNACKLQFCFEMY